MTREEQIITEAKNTTVIVLIVIMLSHMELNAQITILSMCGTKRVRNLVPKSGY